MGSRRYRREHGRHGDGARYLPSAAPWVRLLRPLAWGGAAAWLLSAALFRKAAETVGTR